MLTTLVTAAQPAHAAVCNGATEAHALGIDAPLPPASYTLPDDVIVVSDTEELQAALTWNATNNLLELDIVLLDGVYEPDDLDNGKYLRLWGSHHLWARYPGGAVLKFGIDAGGDNTPGYTDFSTGAEFHGLIFDIDDPSAAPVVDDSNPETVDSYALLAWIDSEYVRVEDCYFRGNGVIGWGIGIASPNGFVASRVEIDDFLTTGIAVAQGKGAPDLPVPVQLRDLVVTNIDDPIHEAPTGESAIKLFATGSLERAYIRNVHRAGVVTGGNLRRGEVRDIDVDFVGDSTLPGVGIYIDNTTELTEISEFCVGPNVEDGVRSEWDNYGGPLDPLLWFPRGINNSVHHGLIEAFRIGVGFDQGTIDSSVEDCIFRNYDWSAISFNKNYADIDDWPNYAWELQGSWEADNTFLEANVCKLVRDVHPNAYPVDPPCVY